MTCHKTLSSNNSLMIMDQSENFLKKVTDTKPELNRAIFSANESDLKCNHKRIFTELINLTYRSYV